MINDIRERACVSVGVKKCMGVKTNNRTSYKHDNT
jgi:hypothetical protein